MATKDKTADPRFFVDIARIDEEQRMVYGYATTEAFDSYGTVIDLARVSEILPDYMRFANIREMHQASAVGVADSATVDDDGLYLAVKVVDDSAWKKVTEKVYKGFSIGGKKDYEKDSRIYLKEITEISLVDRPSNQECLIDEYRIYGQEEHMDESTQETEVNDTQLEVERGVYQVSSMANIIQNLKFLADDTQWESEMEKDGSPVPAKLREALATLAGIFKELAEEEVNELIATLTPATVVADIAYVDTPDMTRAEAETGDDEDNTKKDDDCEKADAPDITRAGARNSKNDLSDLQSIHEACVRLGADCGGNVEKSDMPDLTRIAELEGTVQRLEGENAGHLKRIAELEAEPAPAKGVLRVVGKGDDVDGSAVNRADDAEPETPIDAIRRIHQTGGVTITRF